MRRAGARRVQDIYETTIQSVRAKSIIATHRGSSRVTITQGKTHQIKMRAAVSSTLFAAAQMLCSGGAWRCTLNLRAIGAIRKERAEDIYPATKKRRKRRRIACEGAKKDALRPQDRKVVVLSMHIHKNRDVMPLADDYDIDSTIIRDLHLPRSACSNWFC